jgi:ribosomal protein L40E
MPETKSPLKHRRNNDVECLRCGAMNIPDNKICGRCGASLPLIYDEEGNVYQPRDITGSAVSGQRGFRGARFSPNNARWVLRFCIILFAILLALLIMRHP